MDDISSFCDGSVDVGDFSVFALMILPGGSLFDDEVSDHVVGESPSEQGEGISEIGFGFSVALIH